MKACLTIGFISAVAVTAATAPAATITTTDLAGDGSNLDNVDIVWAYYFPKSGTSSLVANSISFAPIVASSSTTPSTLVSGTGYTFKNGRDYDGNGVYWDNGEFNGTDTAPASSTTFVGNMATIMGGSLRTAGSSSQKSDSVLTLTGLTPGTQYQLQLLHSADTLDFVLKVDGASVTMAYPATMSAKLNTVEFTATGTTLNVAFDANGTRGSVNAMTLAVVPEPASLSLLGLGGLALLRRRRA